MSEDQEKIQGHDQDLLNLEREAARVDAEAEHDQGAGQEAETGAAGGEFIPGPGAIEDAWQDAALLVAGIASFVEDRWGVGVSDKTCEKGAQKLAPLIVKYDFETPFLRRWREEIDAGIFFASCGYAIYKTVKARKVAGEGAEDGEGKHEQ